MYTEILVFSMWLLECTYVQRVIGALQMYWMMMIMMTHAVHEEQEFISAARKRGLLWAMKAYTVLATTTRSLHVSATVWHTCSKLVESLWSELDLRHNATC